CAALVGEDQPLCPDLPELDLSELDVNDLDADSFLGGLKWYSDQSEIISNQYSNEPANIFEPGGQQFIIFPPLRDKKTADVLRVLTGSFNPHDQNETCDLKAAGCIAVSSRLGPYYL
ncbi:hypothetical protein DV515_00002896, partial [Chloebia gouldiae]